MSSRFPLLVGFVAVATIVLIAAVRMGLLDGKPLAIGLLIVAVAVLGWIAFRRGRKLEERLALNRQTRFVAERFQSMVRALPGGYCLFTPEGLLREEYGIVSRLGLKKLTQFDDLASGVKESDELTRLFRLLQKTGESFMLGITPVNAEGRYYVYGRRFRIGMNGPQADVLWFSDIPPGEETPLQIIEKPLVDSSSLTDARQLIDAISFPVWVRNRNLDIVMCNTTYAKALDASVEEVLRKQHELMSQTARAGTGRALAAAALDKNEKQVERRHVIISGKRRLLEITETPLVSSKAEEQQEQSFAFPENMVLLGFAVDVTAEEEKESELQRHLTAHREVMEHLGAAIAVYGRDTRLEFYNRAYQKLWEAEESFLDGHPTFAEVLEDLRARRRLPEQADFQRYKKEWLALFTSLLEPQEDQMFLPDGTTLRILSVPHPFGGIMFVHENVTNMLALESSYNTLMAVQKETLDNLAEGIAVFGPDGRLRLHNPAFMRMWNLKSEFLSREPHISELLEQMKPLFNFGDDWSSFKSEMTGYALDRNPHSGRHERSDGTVIDYFTVPLPDGSVLNSYVDVSDSVRVEQALRASNAALAAADRLKSDFVANVSYQLRTPLNTIAGFADILTEQYFGTLNDKQIEYTRTIKTESEKLSRLINDVLDLAIIEAGRMALTRSAVSIAELLNSAKQMTAEWARQQKLEIIIDCPVGIGEFNVDEHRIKQVLFNLISNSIKYTPEGGRITLGAEKRNGWIELFVSDTGIGIPESDRDRVFGKFERANPQMRKGGAGLGLSLVKSLIELHEGRVEINSSPKGTRVSCFIPQQSPETA